MPRSPNPFYIVNYNIKWAMTTWTYSIISQRWVYEVNNNIVFIIDLYRVGCAEAGLGMDPLQACWDMCGLLGNV